MPDTLARLLEPTELEKHLNHDNVDLCKEQLYQRAHIPGAIHVSPSQLMRGEVPAPGKLPDAARLNTLFSRLGLTPKTHVVAYDDEGGGWAGRLLWIQDVIGHLGENSFVIWDARSREEYDGIRVLSQRGGHIPGAIHCEWTSLMDRS